MDLTSLLSPFMPQTGPTEDDPYGMTAAAKQRKLSDALRLQSQNTPQGQMISGRYVAPSFAQMLAPALAGVGSSIIGNNADSADIAASGAARKARANWVSSLPQGVAAQAGPPDPNNPTELLAKPVTTDRILRHTLAGMDIPGNEKGAVAYNTGALADQAREDKQTEARSTLASQQILSREKQKAELESKAEIAKLRSEDMKLSIQQREDAANLHNETLSSIAEMNNSARRDVAAMIRSGKQDKPPQHLPSAQTTAYLGNKTAMTNIDRALDMLDQNPNAVGLKGFLPNAVLARQGSDSEKATRAEIANIGSLKIHDRSGAAVTVSEAPRLMPFIPTVNDPISTVKTKLQRLRKEAEDTNINLENFADDNQYMRPGNTDRTSVPPSRESAGKVAPVAAPVTKMLGGKTYVNVNGQWFEK